MCFPTVAGMIRNGSIRKICPSDSRAHRRPPPGVCPAATRAAPGLATGDVPLAPPRPCPAGQSGRPGPPFPHLLAGLRSPSGEGRVNIPSLRGDGWVRRGELGMSPGGEQRDGERGTRLCKLCIYFMVGKRRGGSGKPASAF